MAYINPIPYIDKAKKFEMRLILETDELMNTEEARNSCAKYIKGLTVEEISKMLSCETFPVYPNNNGTLKEFLNSETVNIYDAI